MYTRRNFLTAALACGATAAFAPAIAAFPRTASAAGRHMESRIFMGTIVSITVDNAPADMAGEAMHAAFARGRRLEGIFSRFDNASPVGVLNAQGHVADCPQELLRLLERAEKINQLTRGNFNVAVLPLLSLLQGEKGSQAPSSALRQALELADARLLRREGDKLRFLRDGMGLTLDGIAKGHIVQAMSDALADAGCPCHLVNAGGDIVARGSREGRGPWRIAVEDPNRRNRYPQVLALPEGGAVATSGSYEIFFDAARKKTHLICPGTGQSPDIASVTVLARDGLTADALATAASVMPPRDALALIDSLPGVSCCILHKNGLMQTSRAWPGRPA